MSVLEDGKFRTYVTTIRSVTAISPIYNIKYRLRDPYKNLVLSRSPFEMTVKEIINKINGIFMKNR